MSLDILNVKLSEYPWIVYNGFLYNFQKKCCHHIWWKCNQVFSLKCPGVLLTSCDLRDLQFIKIVHEHKQHDDDDDLIKKLREGLKLTKQYYVPLYRGEQKPTTMKNDILPIIPMSSNNIQNITSEQINDQKENEINNTSINSSLNMCDQSLLDENLNTRFSHLDESVNNSEQNNMEENLPNNDTIDNIDPEFDFNLDSNLDLDVDFDFDAALTDADNNENSITDISIIEDNNQSIDDYKNKDTKTENHKRKSKMKNCANICKKLKNPVTGMKINSSKEISLSSVDQKIPIVAPSSNIEHQITEAFVHTDNFNYDLVSHLPPVPPAVPLYPTQTSDEVPIVAALTNVEHKNIPEIDHPDDFDESNVVSHQFIPPVSPMLPLVPTQTSDEIQLVPSLNNVGHQQIIEIDLTEEVFDEEDIVSYQFAPPVPPALPLFPTQTSDESILPLSSTINSFILPTPELEVEYFSTYQIVKVTWKLNSENNLIHSIKSYELYYCRIVFGRAEDNWKLIYEFHARPLPITRYLKLANRRNEIYYFTTRAKYENGQVSPFSKTECTPTT